jgi:RHS repeat-associated protein
MSIHSQLPYDQSTSHARIPAGGIHLIASIDSVSEAQVTASFFGSTKSLHGEFAIPSADTSTHNHSNQQYSINAVTTSAGIIAERYAYSAYGEPTICDASGSAIGSSSAINNRYSYTGREWDETVSLYHFRARWMSPKTGRFLQRDPIGYLAQRKTVPCGNRRLFSKTRFYSEEAVQQHLFNIADFICQNPGLVNEDLYAYTSGGPLRFSDPTGLDRVWVGGAHPLDHSMLFIQKCDGTWVKFEVGGANPMGTSGTSATSAPGPVACLQGCMHVLAAIGPGIAYIDINRTDYVEEPTGGERIATDCRDDEALIDVLEQERLNGPIIYHGWFANCHEYVYRRWKKHYSPRPRGRAGTGSWR